MGNTKSNTGSARLSRDWPPFTSALAKALAALEEDQYLIISVKQSMRYVQFAAQGSFGLRAELSSNAFLPPADRLTKEQVGQLVASGWLAPTGTPAQSTPEADPDGSPNIHIDHPAGTDFAYIAGQAVDALARILRVPYPGFLEYEAFDAAGNTLVFAELGIKHAELRGNVEARAELATRLLAIVREITGIGDLEFDGDGDIGIRFGSASTFIRLIGNPPMVRFFAPLVRNIEASPALLERLNELNASTGHMHFFHREDTILAVCDTPALPLHHGQIEAALSRFCEIADGLDDRLAAEFGGHTLHLEHMPSASIH